MKERETYCCHRVLHSPSCPRESQLLQHDENNQTLTVAAAKDCGTQLSPFFHKLFTFVSSAKGIKARGINGRPGAHLLRIQRMQTALIMAAIYSR